MPTYLSYLLNSLSIREVASLSGISASTLYKYASGAYSPSVARLNVFKNIYGKYTYNLLRESGMPQYVASNRRYSPPSAIESQLEKLNRLVNETAYRYGKDFEDVLEGYYKSKFSLEEIEDRY